MNRLDVPYIEGLRKMSDGELDLALDWGGAKGFTGNVCWPEQYPYRPDCCFAMAHDSECLAILFHVRGLDLRAKALEDNGRVWEDSCCEIFIADPSDGTYYNFEENCIGMMVSGKGAGREGRVRRGPEEMGQIRRITTLKKREIDLGDKIFGWSAGMVIPLSLMGFHGDFPAVLRGNIYKCGDKTVHPHFLSWNPVLTPKPDFHRPEYFGEFKLLAK
jgi:hypothetical protein